MTRYALLISLIAATGAAAGFAADQPAPVLGQRAARGLAFAELRCAGCHGLTANSISSNPDAPPWEDIANRPGTTERTLRTFLRDSHNYPEAMNFTVERGHIRDIAAYMITLKRKGYRPLM